MIETEAYIVMFTFIIFIYAISTLLCCILDFLSYKRYTKRIDELQEMNASLSEALKDVGGSDE